MNTDGLEWDEQRARGYSVLELVAAFERTSGVRIPRRFVPRRRYRHVLCGCFARAKGVRVEGNARDRGDVPRCVAVAEDES